MLVFGSDHAGLALKQHLISCVSEQYDIVDLGTDSLASTDYPQYANLVCSKVLDSKDAMGVLICGTGIGMSMAANRYSGIRAALCGDVVSAKMTRMHNDANVLCLGSRIIGRDVAEAILATFLDESFEGGRHERRVSMIDELKPS